MSLKRLLRSLLCLCIMVMLTLNVGGMHCFAASVSYITAKTDAVVDIFGRVQVSCAVTGPDTYTYTIKNTSSIPAYIRVRIVGNWVDTQGNLSSVQPTYSVTTTDTNWASYEDYYYYIVPIEVNGTKTLTITPKAGEEAPSANHSFRAQVLAEAIQATPSAAVKEAWGFQADSSGALSPAMMMFRMLRMTDEIVAIDTDALNNIEIRNWEKEELDPYNLEYLMDGSLSYYFTAPERYELPETISLFINGEHYVINLNGENNPEGITYYPTTGMLNISPEVLPYGEIGIMFAGEGIKLRPEVRLEAFDLINIFATDINGTYAGSADAELIDEDGNLVLFLEAEEGYYISGRIYLNVNGEDMSFDASGEDMPYGVSYMGGILVISEELLLGGMNSVTVGGVAEQIIDIPDTEVIPDDEEEDEEEEGNGSSGSTSGGDGNNDNDGDDDGDDDNTEGGDDNTEGGDDNTEGGDDNTTGGDDNTEGGDDNTEGGDDNTTGGDDNTDSGDDNTDSGDDNTTGGDDNTEGGDDNTTGGDDNTNNGDDNTDNGDDNTEGGDDNTTGGDDNTEGGDNTNNGDDNTDNGDDNTDNGDDNTDNGDVGDDAPDGPSNPDDGNDNGSTDNGSTDGGSTDGGSTDGGSTDSGSSDGGSTDGGSTDGGSTDGGSSGGDAPAPAPTPSAPSDGGSGDSGSSDGGAAAE